MIENPPTLDEWHRLYQAAIRFKELAPWDWMEEIDLLVVQNPESGEFGFVSVMGMAGEHFGVSVYLGAKSLYEFHELHDNPPADPNERAQRLLESPQLQVSFENRDQLEEADRQTIKELGLRFRGAHAWPLLRSHEPGFLPWFINAAEARFLACALEQTLEVVPRFRDDPALLYPGDDADNLYLARLPSEQNGVLLWQERQIDIPPPEPVIIDIEMDELVLQRLKKLQPGDRVVELDLFLFWSPVQESDERPRFPYVLMMVDAPSHFILGTELLNPDPSLQALWGSVCLEVARQLDQAQVVPQEIRVRSSLLAGLLQPLAEELGFALKQVPALPGLDPAKHGLLQNLGGGYLGTADDFPLEDACPPDIENNFPLEDNFALEGGGENPFSLGSVPVDDFIDVMGTVMSTSSLGRRVEQAQIDFRQILRDQIIDGNGPGSILGDFARMLDLIGTEGIAVTKANKLPQAKFMARLNEGLHQPIDIDIKRPLPKSFPNVNGLYLLLRASGLGLVESSGAKKSLTLNQAALASWYELNPTEQYFALFESWLLRGNPQILGEFAGPNPTPIGPWIQFFDEIPDEGLNIAGNQRWEGYLEYAPGLPNLALMEIFGLLSVRHSRPKPGKGWCVEEVRRTLLGDALLLGFLNYLAEEKLLAADENEIGHLTGQLQPVFQPFFPEWCENLQIPGTEFRDGTYIFRVSLGKVWRRIAISGQLPLDRLSDVILQAFEFDRDHLYQFTVENRFGIPVHIGHPALGAPPFTNEVCVGDLALQMGADFVYLFDFGDHWEFDTALERIDPPDIKKRKPTILEKRGKAPEQYSDWDGDE